jgi:hypothetical protein
MDVDVIGACIAIPLSVALGVLGLLGYQTKKKTSRRREERVKHRWPRDPYV